MFITYRIYVGAELAGGRWSERAYTGSQVARASRLVARWGGYFRLQHVTGRSI